MSLLLNVSFWNGHIRARLDLSLYSVVRYRSRATHRFQPWGGVRFMLALLLVRSYDNNFSWCTWPWNFKGLKLARNFEDLKLKGKISTCKDECVQVFIVVKNKRVTTTSGDPDSFPFNCSLSIFTHISGPAVGVRKTNRGFRAMLLQIDSYIHKSN